MTNREIIKAFEDLLKISRRLPSCRDTNCCVCDENNRTTVAARLALEALKQNYPRTGSPRIGSSWVCYSLDHNENDGCSNPTCFKYYGRKK